MPEVEALPPTGGLSASPAPSAPAAPAAAPGAPAPGAPAPSAPAPSAAPTAPAPAVAPLPADLAQATQDLAAKAPTIRTVAFNISGTRTSAGGAAPGAPEPPLNGRVEAVPPNQFRVEGTSEMGGQEVKLLMIVNGPAMWMEVRDAASDQVKQVIKMDLAAFGGADTEVASPMGSASPDAASVLGAMGKEFAFETVADETLDGEACKVFAGKERQPQGGGEPDTVRAWFSTTDSLVRRVQRTDASGKVTEDFRITNIETNPPLPMSRFEYTPPAGVPVMDMGEMLKQMAQGMGAATEPMGGVPAAPGAAPAEPPGPVPEEDDAAAPENEE
jgi:outer membrane lipoprotein-sorting protein